MQKQVLVQLLGPPGGWISRLEGVPKVSCRALFKVLEGPWASWGSLAQFLGVLGAFVGLLGASRGSSETPGSSPGGLLVAHRSFPQRSWELLGVSWGPSAALGSPLGPLVASKWSSGSPKIGSWETPKSEFQINIQNICFIYKYYMFYYVFWHEFIVFYGVFPHCHMFWRSSHFRVETYLFCAPCAFRAFCFCQGSICSYFIVF